jgi:4'-phosphopantetheinyl transferase
VSTAPQAATAAEAAMHGWVRERPTPVLDAADVHVWYASVSALAPDEERLHGLLDADERARAARFYFAPDRTRYVVAHGVLRTLLGGYTDTSPGALRFTAGAYGKPAIDASSARGMVAFNMSHSADAVVIAVTRNRAVGVDVERWSADFDPLELAREFFSATERAVLGDLPPPERLPGFFACWSRKEAYIKATGFGVSRGLDHFDVDLRHDSGTITDRFATAASVRWTMRDLGLPPGYSGAVVVEEGAEFRLRRMRL